MAAVHAAAAAAVGGGTGIGLFSYNRSNYLFDEELRFLRFQQSRVFANLQAGQYREDIRGLSDMTVAKMDAYHIVATLFLAVTSAIFCAGRIGLHGIAAPGWFYGLLLGSAATAGMFTSSCIWLAMHGALRASCGMTSLLTRKVRLPIPSLDQIDKARVMGSGFEKQRLGDMFRVPFCPHPETVPDPAYDSSGDSEDGLTRAHEGIEGKKTQKSAKRRSKSADSIRDSKLDKVVKNLKKKSGLVEMPGMRQHWGSTNRDSVPSWIRDEQVLRSMGGGDMPYGGAVGNRDPHDAPEHFKLFAAAQMDWWPFDIYARIAMLYATSQFLYAVNYYIIGTAMSELRGFWIAWSCPGCFCIAQALIFKMDVLPSGGNQYFPYMEWAGHVAPFFTTAAMTLDFRWTYTRTSIVVMWCIVLCAYACHFLMILRYWDVANPDKEEQQERTEKPGKAWWPKTWRVPSAFADTLWVIAPPKQLEKGKHDMLHEMQSLSASSGGVKDGSSESSLRNRKGGSVDQLMLRANAIDQRFQNWFDRYTWDNLSELDQQALTDNHSRLRQVNQLLRGAGDSKTAELAEQLTEVDRDLSNFERRLSSQSTAQGDLNRSNPIGTPGFKQAAKEPWQLLRIAIFVAAFGYFWCGCAAMAEALLFDRAGLLKPPGEPPWIRDVKNRHLHEGYVHLSNDPPGMDHGYPPACPRGICSNLHAPRYVEGYDRPAGSLEAVGYHPPPDKAARRLIAEQIQTDNTAAAFENLLEALPKLIWFGGALMGHDNVEEKDVVKPWDWSTGLIQGEKPQSLGSIKQIQGRTPEPIPAQDFLPSTSKAAAYSPTRISWPGMFQPKHLTCGPLVNSGGKVMRAPVAAITAHGFGAIVGNGMNEGDAVETFALHGVLHLGPLVGASWTTGGLQVVSHAGRLATCAGQTPVNGEWRCIDEMHAGIPMPAGARLSAAAVASPVTAASKESFADLIVAAAFEGSSGRVALFACGGKREASKACTWRPFGDIRVPPAASIASLAFAGDNLLVTTQDGRIHRRRLKSSGSATTLPTFASPGKPGSVREWQASCGLADGGMARLALARQDKEASWRPELFMIAN